MPARQQHYLIMKSKGQLAGPLQKVYSSSSKRILLRDADVPASKIDRNARSSRKDYVPATYSTVRPRGQRLQYTPYV
eukprot:1552645-Amphidinium_carterae.2